jgi:Glycosyl transferase family 90
MKKKYRLKRKPWILSLCLLAIIVGLLCDRLFYPILSMTAGAEKRFKNPFACGDAQVSCLINKKILDQKIKAGLPQWAQNQIQEDLGKFASFKKSDLDRFHQKLDMLFRFQVENQQLKIIYKDNLNILPSYQVLADLLAYLVKNGYVADTDFLMGLGDHFTSAIKPTLPIFVFAKDLDEPSERDQVLVPDWMNMLQMPMLQPRIRRANKLYPWSVKDPLLFWRGGGAASTDFRKKLVAMSKQDPDHIDAKFVDKHTVKFVKQEDHLKYKYLIAIDGARATWTRFVWHLQSNSLTFKHHSRQMQWFYKGIEPYIHYIPVKDEKGLSDALAWVEKNQDVVQSMIKESTDFVENHLTLEGMVHYYIVLLQEYAKKIDLKA